MNNILSSNRIKRRLGRKFRRYTLTINPRFFRPSSSPYISGDTFRKESKYIFDETQSFNPSDVKKNDTIFLKTDLKEIYFKTIHPKINNEYVLITHNSDEKIDIIDKDYADEKIINWYAQNLTIPADKQFLPLPIGFENRRYLNNGRLKNLDYVKNKEVIKKNKIISSFNTNTNFPLRNNLETLVKEIPDIDQKKFETPFDYLNCLNKYKFVLCPEGNGLDTHRIWEALLTKTVPIIKKSHFSDNFLKLGLPFLLIEDWHELEKFDENNINNLYENYKDYEYLKYLDKKFWLNLSEQKS